MQRDATRGTSPSREPGSDPRCFKCNGRLQPYRRSGLILEQCEDCRGIFLDGGELERLIDAEGGGWSGQIGAPWVAGESTGEGGPISACQSGGRTQE